MSVSKKTKSCSCRRRSKGNPKYGHGPCRHSGDVRPAVRERIAGKRLCRRWLWTQDD